jgi:hypothetical protein
VAIYRVWPLLFPEVATSIQADPSCDLRAGPCTSSLDSSARVSFAIEPREIPLLKTLKLRVELQGLEAQQVEVDFSGVDMNMGFNRFKLAATKEGVFAGEGILPVCVRDAMEWEARVMISTSSGLKAVAYRFITVRSGLPLPDRNGQTTR